MLYEHIRTAVVDDECIPWTPFVPYSDEVQIKLFKADPIRGETITLLKAPARAELPMHHHSGTVIVYTIEGRWKYKEHDWIAGPGSIVFETAASRHTPEVISQEGHVITLNIVVGDLIFLDAHGHPVAIENWQTAVQRYENFCQGAGITPRDVTAFN